jgi:beta-galactosidase
MTSYDYDAPISEAGWATEKYMAIREKIAAHTKKKLPEIPAPITVIEIPEIRLDKAVAIDALLRDIQPVTSDQPLTFEAMNQGHGYLLYRRHFVQPISGILNIKGLRDYATIYVNGEKTGELNRYYKNYSCPVEVPFNANLEILVENMGRINYGAEIIHNLKGIISPVMIDSTEITGNWEMYRLPMDQAPDLKSLKDEYLPGRATIYSGSFELKETGDTFLDFRTWGKGIVFVNGHHLGRYWSVGPQQTLYLPGCWLKKGTNQVVIFEQKPVERKKSLSSIRTPILEELKK